MTEDLNPHHVARTQFDLATPFVGDLEGWRGISEWLFEPEKIVTVTLPVEMDDTVRSAVELDSGIEAGPVAHATTDRLGDRLDAHPEFPSTVGVRSPPHRTMSMSPTRSAPSIDVYVTSDPSDSSRFADAGQSVARGRIGRADRHLRLPSPAAHSAASPSR